MTGISKILTLFAVAGLTVSCADPDERYDAGYSDGYAVGYNTTCQIRATMIEGDWGNADYSRGYADGNDAGSAACLRSKNEQ